MSVVLFSGGIDSLGALLWAKERYEKVIPLYVKMGHRYEKKEFESAKSISKHLHLSLKTISLRIGKWEEPNAFIPFRNLFLISAGALLAYKDDRTVIIQNCQSGETSVGDRTERFNSLAQETLSEAIKQKVTVISPFTDYSKVEIVKYILDKGGGMELPMTMSCYSPEPGHCGWCPACFRRFVALALNKICWGGEFNRNPLEWEGVKKYAERAKRGEFGPKRSSEILKVLEAYGYGGGVQ